MEIKLNINCSKEAFFSFLCANLKKEFEVENIFVGITTKKDILSKMGKKIPCELKLVYLKENKGYKIEIISQYGKNTIEYLILDNEQKKVTLKYIEKYIANSKINKYNNIVMEIILGYFLKKNKIKTLKQIDRYLFEKEKNG